MTINFWMRFQIDKLLSCQEPASQKYGPGLVHDEYLFIITHQGKNRDVDRYCVEKMCDAPKMRYPKSTFIWTEHRETIYHWKGSGKLVQGPMFEEFRAYVAPIAAKT